MARFGKLPRRGVAGMRAAAHDVRRAHHRRHAGGARRRRRFKRGRELGDRHPVAAGQGDLLHRRVVVAGQHDAARFGDLDDARPVFERPNAADPLSLSGHLCEIGSGPSRLAGVIDEVFLEIPELPLAGCMIHERDELRRVGSEDSIEEVDDVRRRDFAAQMGEMVGAQKICVGRPADRLREQRDLSPSCAPTSNSSTPTRNESKTVVIPAAAICAS